MEAVERGGQGRGGSRADEKRRNRRKVRLDERVGLDVAVRRDLLELRGAASASGYLEWAGVSYLGTSDALQEGVGVSEPGDEALETAALEQALRNREPGMWCQQGSATETAQTHLASLPTVMRVVSMTAGRLCSRKPSSMLHRFATNVVDRKSVV